VTAEADGPLFGRSVLRVEDERLLRGSGRFVDDLHPQGCLEAAFLRSPHAHARIGSIDAAEALALPGVVAVLTGADVAELVDPMVFEVARIVPDRVREAMNPMTRIQPMHALAVDRVTYVGQPVAMVVADSRYTAEDALELVDVTYDPLPAVVDPEAALEPGAPLVEPDWGDNVAISFDVAHGDADAAFADAAVVVEERFRSHRYTAAPMETRGVVADVDPYDGRLTVWAASQMPHVLRDFLAGALRCTPADVRVVAADVGGGFGLKGSIYPEDLLVPLAARQLGRAVKWIEDRSENLSAATHAREQVHRIAIAADADGRILGVRDDIVVNAGAYNTIGLVVPHTTACHLLGPYVVPAVKLRVRVAVTHTGITAPYRGAGRPEAVFAMERAMDRLARAVGQDPADVRALNMIPADRMPYATGLVYRDGAEQVYDSGDYPTLLAAARELAEPALERARAAAGRRAVGIGYAAYIEGTGFGPFEAVRVSVEPSGRVRVYTGVPSQGQGLATTLAQITADELGVRFEDVDVVSGDSGSIAHGYGTIASRALVFAGNGIAIAAAEVRERALRLAGDMLEAAPEDLELAGGVISVRGTPGAQVPLAAVAEMLTPWNPARPAGEPVALEAETHWRPTTVTYAAGVHAAIVAVDLETGMVEVLSYVVAHDCGRVVNPAIADGQIVGGVMQGIGGALYEEVAYDDDGQLRTGSFMDYVLPTAGETPEMLLAHIDSPSPLNPLGVKGLGEGGAIGPPASIAGAVEDALASLGVVVRDGPLGPSQVRALIREAGAGAGLPVRTALST
jgi:carbon-monoxide dehydrogenase large subunit